MVSLPERAPRRLPLARERDGRDPVKVVAHRGKGRSKPPSEKRGCDLERRVCTHTQSGAPSKGLCRPVEVCAFGVCEDVRIWMPCGIQTRIVLLLSAALACAGSGAKARQAITGFILLRTTSSSRQGAVVAFLGRTAPPHGSGASGLRRDEAHLLPIDAENLC
mgnify:FL=1